MSDPSESARREMVQAEQSHNDLAQARINGERQWTTAEMTAEFEVMGFSAPFVVVRRRSDGKVGSLEFTPSPRVYFGWKED